MKSVLRLIFFILTFSTSSVYAQFGPGGVGNAATNKLWLCADKGLTTNAGVVTSWHDQSGNENHPLGIEPAYISSSSSFNNMPSVNFSNAGPYKEIFELSSEEFSVFTVYTITESSLVPLWTTDNSEEGYIPNFNGEAKFIKGCTYQKTGLTRAVGQGTVSCLRYTADRSQLYFDGKKKIELTGSFCPSKIGSFSIGGSYNDGNFQGDVSEIFFFNGNLNTPKRVIIENYLAAKYGLPTDNEIYKHAETHPNDVIGIGKKDDLTHDDSQGTGMVRISNPTNLGNSEYLFVGHDSGDLTNNVFDCGSVSFGRTWKVSEAGEVGNVKLRFDISSLPDNPNELNLLIDRDEDGYSDEIPISGEIVGSYLEFNNVDLESDDLFTLGHVINSFNAGSSGVSDADIWSINGVTSEMYVEFCPEINIVIPSGSTVLNDMTEIICKDFVIEPGASFDMGTSGSKITVYGNWDNQGTFLSGNGEISFEGTVDQFINGDGTQEWGNLTINTSDDVIITSGTHRINGTLNIVDGKFRTNDEVVLASSANGTAQLAELINGQLIGQVTVERFMNTNRNDWHLICSPIEGLDYEAWDDDLVTTGIPGSDYPGFAFQSIRTYDETVPGDKDLGIGAPSSMNEAIPDLLGAWVFIANGNQKFEAKGNIFTGDHSFPVTYTNSGSPLDDGWNLIGNPYPSGIDWDDPSWDKTNVNDAIYVWDPAIQQYNSYIGGVGINGGSQFIPSGQAFWIQTNKGGPNLKVREPAKTGQVAAYKSETDAMFFKLVVSNGIHSDETAIKLDPQAEGSYEELKDAIKFSSPNLNVPQIASLSLDSNLLGINATYFDAVYELIIPLKIWGKEGDQLTINAIHGSELSQCISLEDEFTGVSIDIMNESYTFENLNAESNRFVLRISKLIDVTAIPVGCTNDLGGEIIIEAFGVAPWTLELTNENANPVAYTQTSTGFEATNLSAGLYKIEYGNQNEQCKSSIQEVEILGKNPVKADFLMEPTIIDLKFTDEVEFINASENAVEYLWNFGNGLYGIEENPINTYSVKGDYEITLSAKSGACSSLAKKELTVIDTRINIEPIVDNKPKINLTTKDGILTAKKLEEVNVAQLRVYNLSGQLIHSQNWESSRDEMLVYLPPTFNIIIVSYIGNDGSVISTDRILH